jgi:hypothetical protein
MEVWVSDIDGGNKLKLASGETLATGRFAPDNFHLSFSDGHKINIVGADGTGLRQLAQTGAAIDDSVWSPDQQFIYVTTETGPTLELWKWSVDGSTSDKIVDNCGVGNTGDPSGHYLLGIISFGERTGIYMVPLSDRKCVLLLPGVETFAASFAPDGKSFLYAVASRGEVTIYRQPWKDGKLTGAPQVGLKLPFVFPLVFYGNAYDFSRDLSTIVYARPGGSR